MQKRNLLYLSILAAVIFCFSYAQAALQFLPRYQGSYGTRNQEGGRDKVEVSCKTYGGVEKGTNQTCTGQFIRAGLTCYKSCSCNKSKFQYTIASHQGSGKLCESLSNACTDSAGTSYSNCVLNTCNVRNSTWIGENSKSSYTSNNYTCTTQNTSGKDGTCYVCACPSSWATGSCPANSATCSTCKAISPYTVSKFNLVSCKAGYYKNGNSCTQCPAGSYCDGINKTLCPAGSYSAAGASSCTSCSAGTYSAKKGATKCESCAAGTYSTKGSSKCLDCSAGTYSNAGASSCTSCSAGKYSSAKASYCNTCAAGTYSAAGASSCTDCPAGKYSAAGASSCSTCAAGTYSSAGASSCTKCAAGKYSAAGASSCSTCAAGTYSAAGASSCTNCAAGKYSKAGSSSCSSCSGNTYSAAGAGSCTSCSSGSVANSTHTDCLNDTCASGYTKTACAENQIQTGTTTTAAGSTCYACQTKDLTCAEYISENKISGVTLNSYTTTYLGSKLRGPSTVDYAKCKELPNPTITVTQSISSGSDINGVDIKFVGTGNVNQECLYDYEYCREEYNKYYDLEKYSQCMQYWNYSGNNCTDPSSSACCTTYTPASWYPYNGSVSKITNATISAENGINTCFGSTIEIYGKVNTTAIGSHCYTATGGSGSKHDGGKTIIKSGANVTAPIIDSYLGLLYVEKGAVLNLTSSTGNNYQGGKDNNTALSIQVEGTLNSTTLNFVNGPVTIHPTGILNVAKVSASDKYKGKIIYSTGSIMQIGNNCRKATSSGSVDVTSNITTPPFGSYCSPMRRPF